MANEQSHGKARPALPRASDLQTTESATKPTNGRTPDGRFMAGNRASLGARFTATTKKSLGTKAATGEALIVARDARKLFGHTLASLPSDAPPVRALLAIYSRHAALHATRRSSTRSSWPSAPSLAWSRAPTHRGKPGT
jgi:hypothetical protein